jgi:serine/threonine-protein kinase
MTDENIFAGPHRKQDLVGNRYVIIGYIGAGGMQYVYKARDTILNRLIALKTPIDSSAAKRFLQSAKLSAKVNHPNVAKTLDYIETDGRQYLVEELVEGDDLDTALLKKVHNLDPYLVARIFHNLAKGIAASHHANVIHRDLKPTNIMVGGKFPFDVIKITDFGIATMAQEKIIEEKEKANLTNSTSKTVVGALPYMAPEAITDPRNVSNKVDIWSLGAMTFELLTGSKPFGSGLPAIQKILNKDKPEFHKSITAKPQFRPLANKLIEIINDCFHFDPTERPTADQIVARCSLLCYSTADRYTGTLKEMRNSWTGWITHEENGSEVFFHIDSVYGHHLSKGDRVMFSSYPASPYLRAHPIVKLV